MKKKLLNVVAILLMVAMLVSLTACGDDSSKKSEKEESASSPKAVIEEFLGYVEDGKFSKASKLVDWTFTYKVYDDSYYSYDEYDYSEIEEMSKKEIKEYEEDNDYSIEYAQEAFEDYESEVKDMYSFKLNADVEKGEKVKGTKNIYKVEAELEMVWQEKKKDDEETSSKDVEFYLIKDGDEYKIIDGVYQTRYLLSDLYW